MGVAAWMGLAVLACGGATVEPVEPVPPARTQNENPRPPLGAEPQAPADLPGRAWLEPIHARVFARWSEGFLESCRVYLPNEHPLNSGTLEAVVSFDVSPDGTVKRLALTAASWNAEYDAAVLEIARDLGDLGPTPLALRSDDGNVYVSWLFARDERQAGLAGVTIDRRLRPVEESIPLLLRAGHIDEALDRLREAGAGATVELVRKVAIAIVESGFAAEGEAAVRISAARAAGRSGATSFAPRLIELARGDRDLALRVAAIEALGTLRPAAAAPVLLEILEALDGERSAAAGIALGALGMGSAAWDKLAPRVATAATRTAALVAARGVSTPAATKVLAQILADTRASRGDRVLAAEALGTAGARAGDGDAALRALATALIEGDAGLRAATAQALARAGEAGARSRTVAYKIVPALKDRDPRVRAAAIAAAGLLGPGVHGRELVALAARERSPDVLEAIATGLAAVPQKEALAALTVLARSEVPAVRARALRSLATRTEPEARALVAAQTSDPEPSIRLLAVRAQAEPGALGPALADDQPPVIAAAFEQLVRLGSATAAVVEITRALAADTAAARVAAAEGWLAATAAPVVVR